MVTSRGLGSGRGKGLSFGSTADASSSFVLVTRRLLDPSSDSSPVKIESTDQVTRGSSLRLDTNPEHADKSMLNN